MIEVSITDDGKNVGNIKLELEYVNSTTELATYNVTLYTDRGEDVLGMHQCKIVYFPVNALNPLALVLAALKSLPPHVFGAEDDAGSDKTKATVPTDLERRLNRAMQALPTGLRGLRYHGPAFRGEQSEQHGDDTRGQSERS